MISAEVKSVFDLVLHHDQQRSIQAPEIASRPLEVNVLCTSMPATLIAMDRAVALARGLNARLHLFVAQVVPYAAPLESPPVLVEFQEALFRELAQGCGLETRVGIFLCRDAGETFLRQLPPHSVVVLGAGRRWSWTRWFARLFKREERLARRLRRAGHQVVVVYMKGNTHA
jgi:hypothetical protein